MLRYVEKVLKHYAATDTAYRDFLDKAKHCKPLLNDDELQYIWEHAKKFSYEQVFSQKDYVNPDTFNDEAFMLELHDYTDAGETKSCFQTVQSRAKIPCLNTEEQDGKSTFFNSLQKVLGTYADTVKGNSKIPNHTAPHTQ